MENYIGPEADDPEQRPIQWFASSDVFTPFLKIRRQIQAYEAEQRERALPGEEWKANGGGWKSEGWKEGAG